MMNILRATVLILIAIYFITLILPKSPEKTYVDLWNDNVTLSDAYLECVDNTATYQELIKELISEADKCFEIES